MRDDKSFVPIIIPAYATRRAYRMDQGSAGFSEQRQADRVWNKSKFESVIFGTGCILPTLTVDPHRITHVVHSRMGCKRESRCKPFDKHRKCTTPFRRRHVPAQASQRKRKPLTLLLGHTDGSAAAASGLGVLTTDTETPVVTETTMSADLLQALEIVTELGGDTVSKNLAVLAIDDITLPVEEPIRDLVCK